MQTTTSAAKQLENILAGTQAGTWIWDVPEGALSINERAAQLLGHGLHELAPIHFDDWRERLHPEDRPQFEAALQRHFELTDSHFQCELRVRHAQGHWAWLQVHGKVVERDEHGQPLRMYGTLMDIAARKQAEAERELLLDRLEELSASIPGFLYQYRLRPDGSSHFPYASEGIDGVYGCTPAEVLDDAGPVFAVLHPDDLERVVQGIGASAHQLAPWHDTYRVRHPRLGQRWVEGDAQPTAHADGSITWHGYLRDVTARHEDQQRLRLAAAVFASSQEGIVVTDAARRIVDINPAFTRITGYSRDEALGQRMSLLQSGKHPRSFYQGLLEALAREGRWQGEIWNRRKNGEIYVQLLSIDSLRDEAGQLSHYVGVFEDIDRLKAQELALERLAHYDPLTELPNRRLLDAMLRAELSRAQRSGRILAVAYLDLDGFKDINDRHGHDLGDALLRNKASAIRETLRLHDTMARLGGDEFGLLLTDLEDNEDCIAVVERVQAVVAQPVDLGGQTLSVTASMGLTLYPDDDVDGDTLLRHADQAMLEAKRGGRNRFQVFDALEDRRLRGVQALLTQVERGLQVGEFRLHYQPKVDLRDGSIVGLEALIRWERPGKGLVPPGEFLPALQRSRLDRLVGEWVIGEAVRQCLDWQTRGLQLNVSVNVSGQHLLHPQFLPFLESLIGRSSGLGRGQLEMEILESTELDDLDTMAQALGQADALGVCFALDDFGTGYSSLTTLRRLPVQTIKIDQSFVRGMLEQADDIAIVEGVLAMAKSFGRQVVAEGVETAAHSRCLQRLGCHLAQGYGIARPMPAQAVPAWVEAWQADWPGRQVEFA